MDVKHGPNRKGKQIVKYVGEKNFEEGVWSSNGARGLKNKN
jgi:hypothetical protein